MSFFRIMIASLWTVLPIQLPSLQAQTQIDFEGLSLGEDDSVGTIGIATFSGDAAIQGGAAFAFGSPTAGPDTGLSAPFSTPGNTFLTNVGGVQTPDLVKTVQVDFLQAVGCLSFSVADIDSIAPEFVEEVRAQVFDAVGAQLGSLTYTAPISIGMLAGDASVVRLDFGGIGNIRRLLVSLHGVGTMQTSSNGWGIDDLRFTRQSALQVSRLGSPPNPDSLIPGQSSGPVVGATWDPVVDHTSFMPGSILDFLIVGGTPANIPTPIGTALCDPSTVSPLVFTKLAGNPFNIPIPAKCNLVGVSLCIQALSYDLVTLAYTNALDITIGTF